MTRVNILTLLVSALSYHPAIQTMLTCIVNLTFLVYLIILKPYTNLLQLIIAILIELSLLLAYLGALIQVTLFIINFI